MILNEWKRTELINKSKKSDKYKDTSKGKNRWDRRLRSKVATSVSQYNKIDMNEFFKKDILTIGIDVHGETDDYIVTMKFNNVLDEIQKELKRNNGVLDFRVIYRSLTSRFNNDDVYINCTCPDYKYRMNYWSTKNDYESTFKQLVPSDITNPNDTKGAGCKHVNLVLSNLNWLMKVTSTIHNYINWCKKNMKLNYADIIFPAVYGEKYKDAVQLGLFDDGLLPSDKETLDKSNIMAKKRGQFKKGNPYRITKDIVRPEKNLFDKEEDNSLVNTIRNYKK